MECLYAQLEMVIDKGDLARVVAKHSWENIPEAEKGEGKMRRKVTPESFREDLTPEQVEIVERICKPILQEFYEQ